MKTEFDTPRVAGLTLEAKTLSMPVTVEDHVCKDIYGWARATDREVSGWGLVKLVNGAFHVYKAFIPEQVSSHGLTTIKPEATARLYQSFLNKLGPERYADVANDLKLWWHSHVNGAVFWSGTDDIQAQRNAKNAGDWGLSIVVNHKGEYRCRVDLVDPVKVMLDGLKINLVSNTGMESKRNYKSDIKRWNHEPEPEPTLERIRRFALWNTDGIELEEVKQTEFVNFAGTTIRREDFDRMMSCPCGDLSCRDCAGTVREAARAH